MPSLIKTIADELNTSTASVSRALNDQPGVSETLRTRILQRAAELNYTPNAAARGLAKAQAFAVGFFVRQKPDLSAYTDPFYGEILHGAEKALAQSEYHLSVANLTDDILNNPKQFRFVRERRVDAMILAGPDIPSDFVISMIQSGLPVVLVDNLLEYSAAHAINGDDEGGAYLAARHLLALGHTHIGLLSGPLAWPSNRRRVQGYQRAITGAGLSLTVVYAEQTTIDSGQKSFQQIIESGPNLTAIGAVNDSMALGAIRAAQGAGLQVPNDISVIGFDNIAWASLNNPPLTTLDVPKQQLGIEAAHRLLSLLTETENPPLTTQLTIAVRLIERASTAAPRSHDHTKNHNRQ